MPKSRLNTRLLATILASALFISCGGGGSSSGTATAPGGGNPPAGGGGGGGGGGGTTPPPSSGTPVSCTPAQAGSKQARIDNSVVVDVGTPSPVGQLAHDGPATPEQIALVLPVTGALPQTATATVRYRLLGSSDWLVGHPMFRVRPGFSNTPEPGFGGAVQDVFAWPIIDLTPGATYEVQVAVRDGSNVTVRTLAHQTRALPGEHGPVNKTANSVASITSAVGALNPGDVLEIAPGTYDVGLNVARSGTADRPIYIRGASRTGTVLRKTSGTILAVRGSHVIVENLTLQGSGVEGGRDSTHYGILLGATGVVSTRITIRNLRVIGADVGVNSFVETTQSLIYDNTFAGNNLWTTSFIDGNITWGDEGIKLPGQGNVAFQNSLSGFGDSFAYASHNGGAETENYNIHFYRNDIRNGGDDAIEADHARRNVTWYDNRIRNVSTCDSLDPLYGGPWVSARNICINPHRMTMHKYNNNNTGYFLYNNTVIGTVTRGLLGDRALWYQPNNGQQRAYGYRNNVHIYHGAGQALWLESDGHDPIDWTHNSWFPDRQIQWGGVFPNLAAAKAGLGSSRTPIFSGTGRRMEEDNITEAQPWTTPVNLGVDSYTEITEPFVPTLRAGTSPKNTGVVIPNITDGFSGGAAPDRGAIIAGRPVPQYGDCTPP